MVIRLALLLAASLPGNMAVAHATPADCREPLLPSSPRTATGLRQVTARDLVELRDFGRAEGAGDAFSVSPDGRHAALTLRQAQVDTDSYCIGIVLVALDGKAPPRLLDTGGEPILGTNDVFGIPGIVSGVIRPGTPVWSPDGKSLVYLRRDHGVTQVWRVGLDGGPAVQLTRSPADMLTLASSPAGLVVTTRASLAAAQAAIDSEEPDGFLYDERFWLATSTRPHPRLPLPVETQLLDPATGALRPGTYDAADRGAPPGAELLATAMDGSRAWTALADPARPFGPSLLHLEVKGRKLACDLPFCREPIAGLWWAGPGDLILMRGPSAANGGTTGFYRWRVGRDPEPVRLFETIDLLASCQWAAGKMFCAREAAASPRALARLDLETGAMMPVFDPNPEFARIVLGRATRLRWTDASGVASFGDLVLPPGHKPGQRHPLVIVQYLSRGFLRGGTGDEYPIHLFASRGFAVLSVQKPGPLRAMLESADVDEAQRINVTGWAERRGIFRSLDAGIDAAIATGSIDAEQIGITGFSDGGGTVQFALINSGRFKAAAISSCCDEPGVMFALGPSYAASGARWGYPLAGEDGRDYWNPQSLALNAKQLRVPLLIQVPDSEARGAAETYAALKGNGAPVEMYVFAGEHHIKTRPAHRQAIYRRSLAWFEFWLRGDAGTGAPSAELERWRAMRGVTVRPSAAPSH